MSAPEVHDAKLSGKTSFPRWLVFSLGLVFWTVLLPSLHGVVPWGLSLLTDRYGWELGRPGIWNLLALVLVAVGAVLFIWVLVLHFVRIPQRVEFELTPKYLLKGGPYRFTRNPMFLALLALWLGWALFYGGVAVLIGCSVLWIVMSFVVRWEERRLEARFGEAYLPYKRTVPRWLGKARS